MIVIPEWGEGHRDRLLLAVGSFVWVALDHMPTRSHECVLPEMQESGRIHHCRQRSSGCSHHLKSLHGLEKRSELLHCIGHRDSQSEAIQKYKYTCPEVRAG